MTKKKFYEVLADMGLAWSFDHPARLRARVYPFEHSPDVSECVCPITAVCFNVTGKLYDVEHAESAAVALKLSEGTRLMLVEAADSFDTPFLGTKKARAALLKAVNLQERGS